MHPVLAFTRSRRVPLNIRRLVGGWFIGKSDRTFEVDVGSVFRGKLDNYIEWMVYVTGEFFEFPYINLVRELHEGGTALDIGANVGNHTQAFSGFFDRVYAVEPYPPVYDRLCARREFSNRIHTSRVALSDRNGTVSFRVPESDNLGIGRIAEDGETSVETIRGDDFVRNEIDGPVDFVKIDVEGHEVSVIKGLAETLRVNRPTVMFEASKEVLRSPDSIRACFGLFPEDYVFHTLSGQSTWPVQRAIARTFLMDARHPRPRRSSCDIICLGREKSQGLLGLDRRQRK